MPNFNRNLIYKKKGITLISLVVTIIILLILAGITINLILSEGGLFEKVQNATDIQKQETAREKLSLAILDLQVKKQSKIQLSHLIEITDNDIKVETTDEQTVAIYEEEQKKYAICNVDGYKFKVYDNLEIVLLGQEKIEEEAPETLEYIQEGLIVWYDGENNTGNGHNSTVNTWTNLAKETFGQNDGTLMNIDFTEQSGWTDDSLILDGFNDWVKMTYLHYENMTIEIVAKPLDIDVSKGEFYLSNTQNGGISISKNISNCIRGQSYIDGSYTNVISTNPISIGTTYSMSTGYDGTNVYYRENSSIYKEAVTGKFIEPEDSTIFAIGTNPNGYDENLGDSAVRPNIEVYSVRIYNRCLTNEEIQHNYEVDNQKYKLGKTQQKEELGYVEDGLICLYDGKQNTIYGHSTRSETWMDLTGNNNDGTLINVDKTASSGWTSNSLILDGKDDWVKMKYIYYKNMTIEIVLKPLSNNSTKLHQYISNFQNGGIGIQKNTSNYVQGSAYIGGSYAFAISSNAPSVGKSYSMSTGYDGTTLYYRENNSIYKTNVTGTNTAPTKSTIFAIGTNPNGENEGLTDTEVRTNMEVYSVRIYNRCLTEQEIQHNYEIDKERFNIP